MEEGCPDKKLTRAGSDDRETSSTQEEANNSTHTASSPTQGKDPDGCGNGGATVEDRQSSPNNGDEKHRTPALPAARTTDSPPATEIASNPERATTTPPRDDRAQRLARTREKINEAGVPNRSPMNSTTTRSRLPPIATPEPSPTARTPQPGDDLVASLAISSRSRSTAAAFVPPYHPETTTAGPTREPLPPGPRLKGGTAPLPTTATTTLPRDQTPGAYPERARAIGDLPSWVHQDLLDARSNHTANSHRNYPSSEANCATDSEQIELTAAFTITTSGPLGDMESSGLANAEPVAEGETVVYAEDIKEDEIVQARRKLVGIAVLSVTIIVVLSIVLLVVSLREKDESDCHWPIERQTISIYCRCHNTAKGYLEHLQKDDPSLFLRYEQIKRDLNESTWMNATADHLSVDSCHVESMVLQTMAAMSKGVRNMEYFNRSQKFLGETYLMQMFAIQSLYFTLNGDSWTRKHKWLNDSNICSWEGLNCDFPTRVSAIHLANNNLQGVIPSYVSLTPSLKELDLSNNKITGEVPSHLTGLSVLEELRLAHLDLNSTIPTEFGLMTNLHIMELQNNSITGTIPTEFGNLRLFMLRLDINGLHGTLPQFWEGDDIRRTASLLNKINTNKTSRMRFFSVRWNYLTGSIPESIMNYLDKLEYIDLSYNNFSGPPPDFVSVAPNLEMANLIDSGFRGYLPDNYCKNTNSRVTVLADCDAVKDCLCCSFNASLRHVLQCTSDLDPATQRYVTGENEDDERRKAQKHQGIA